MTRSIIQKRPQNMLICFLKSEHVKISFRPEQVNGKRHVFKTPISKCQGHRVIQNVKQTIELMKWNVLIVQMRLENIQVF